MGGELIQEDYEKKMKDVEEEIKSAKIEFEAREELEVNKIKNMKDTLALKKELLVDTLITNINDKLKYRFREFCLYIYV